MNTFDSQGRSVPLGARIAEGGEGTVYEVTGHPKYVAKIFKSAASSEKKQKLALMVSLNDVALATFTTWPQEIIYDSTDMQRRQVSGFLMRNASGHKEVHRLYSPKSRATDFEAVDWRFLVNTAANISRAFALVHDSGHVVGDVNHSSVMIARDSTVKLIDCDSFQVAKGNVRYLCEVGEPLHTAPELQGKPFRGVVRTPNHDNFGLAVLIFELLFMGRHPFAGGHSGQGNLTLEQKIAGFLFAYGANSAQLQVTQPPYTLDLAATGPQVKSLFEQAFSPRAAEEGRPSAATWVKALTDLQGHLRACSLDPAHFYLETLKSCPWCGIESETGVSLFTADLSNMRVDDGFSLDQIWELCARVADPGQVPTISFQVSQLRKPENIYKKAGRGRRVTVTLGVLAALAFIIVGITSNAVIPGLGLATVMFLAALGSGESKVKSLRVPAKDRYDKALKQLNGLQAEWNAKATSYPFDVAKVDLADRCKQYRLLNSVRERKLRELKISQQSRELAKFLDQHQITPGVIDGIGSGRCATLRSFGIETAADITDYKVFNVPGFGQGLTNSLVSWRDTIVRKFRFDATKGLDKEDLKKLDVEMLRMKRNLQLELKRGPAKLEHISGAIISSRKTLAAAVTSALTELSQAEANLKAL